MKTIPIAMTIAVVLLAGGATSGLAQDNPHEPDETKLIRPWYSFSRRFERVLKSLSNEYLTDLQQWLVLADHAECMMKEVNTKFLCAEVAGTELRTLEGMAPQAKALAAIILAKLAVTDTHAFDVLVAEACKSNFEAQTAFSAAPVKVARRLAEKLFSDGKILPDRVVAVDLLGRIGDAGSLQVLQSAAEETRKEARYATWNDQLGRAIAELEELLKRIPEAEQDRYRKMHLDYWLLERMRGGRGDSWEWIKAKDGAMAGMRFTSGFLAMKLAQGQSLAAAIAGQQKETTLIPDLERLAHMYFVARLALVNIKTKEAVLALLRASVDSKQNSIEHKRVATFAAEHGDREAAAELQRLAANIDYPEESRNAFIEAAEAIAAKQTKNP